ncbi:MAG: EamA family transporter [Spirochaetales bacterium]|nr:EamA family transporter [Spirochaetales bacterium]
MIYILSTVAAGILWGMISLFVKPLSALGLTSIQILFVRSAISAVIMLIYLLCRDRSLLRIRLQDLWMFIGTGIVSLTFFSLCYFTSILRLGVSVAVILLYTSPIFVLIFSVLLFQERLTALKITALAVTFAGCVLVTGLSGSQSVSFLNVLIGIGAGLGYGLYSIFSRFALQRYKPITVTFYTFVCSAVSLIPFCRFDQFGSTVSIQSLLLCIGISVCCTVLPYLCYTFGLSGMENGKAAILATVEPLVGAIIGFTVFAETVTLQKVIGILLILMAVVILGVKVESD